MRANIGPMDLAYLLSRRRVSFERWCDENGITTRESFEAVKKEIEDKGEFFLNEGMTRLSLALPEQAPEAVPVLEPIAVAETPADDSVEPSESEETLSPGKKSRKKV